MKHSTNLLILLAGSFLLVSCQHLHVAEVERELPNSDVPTSFKAIEATVPMPERWWNTFGSQELNALMDQAFAGNLTLARTWTRMRQARAAARSAAADGKLQLTGSADTSRTRNHTDLGTSTSKNYAGALSISYEVDVWGRLASTTDAARLEAEATEQDVRATALSLSSEIAQAWIAVKSYQAQVALLETQIEAGKASLELLRVRQRKAMSDLVDVLQQRQDVAGLESTAEALRENLAVARLELAYLLGLSDDRSLEFDPEALPDLPALPSPGLPSELLSRRPDIAASRLRLRAQEKTVGAARAARLPSLTLTGNTGVESNVLDDLLDNWATNLAAGLSAPLLDGSRLKAEVDRARAALDEQLLDYRDTVLTAVMEVNEALTREKWKVAYVSRLQTESRYADETLTETRQHYLKGKNDYLSVLTALTAKQTSERAVIAAQAALLANRISLYAALGGDWMNSLQEP